MRKIQRKICFGLLIFLASIFSVTNLNAQYLWDVGATFGVGNYLGEIGGGAGSARPFVIDLKMDQTRWSYGGFVRYHFKGAKYPWLNNMAIRAELGTIRLQGADSLSENPERKSRNLSFKNDIIEFMARAEYDVVHLNDFGNTGRYILGLNMYAFLGAGIFYNNPKAYYNGAWWALQPLKTEGKSYSKIQYAMPIGGGFYFTYLRKFRLGAEFAWRFSTTDYIDDVSKTYPRDNSEMTPTAIALSNRNPELAESPVNRGNYGPVGEGTEKENPRGDPTDNDSYLTINITGSYVIRGKYKNARFNATRSSGAFKGRGRKTVRRRTRAKF